jgi:hypothetical protein
MKFSQKSLASCHKYLDRVAFHIVTARRSGRASSIINLRACHCNAAAKAVS